MHRQISLLKTSQSSSKDFGGELLKNKRKTTRPLSSKKSIHLVLRSQEILKMGTFHKHRPLVKRLLAKYSKKFGVKIYNEAICTNHIHLVLRFSHRKEFISFLRVFCGQVAQKLSAAKNFWLYRPFTRISEWGKDFRGALNYVTMNELETHHLISYQKRKSRYRRESLSRMAFPNG